MKTLMKKSKMEFSKKIFIFVAAVTVIVTAFTMYMVWETKDLTPLVYLIPAIFAETASATSFYFWKSKAENQLKIARSIKEEKLCDEINGIKEITDNAEYM